VKLWQAVFEKAPYRSKVGLNLAYAFCESHQSEQARDYALRVLEFDPDQPGARALLKGLDSIPPKCTQ
jgi:Tfp pilus assembly protein PilF